MLIVGAVFLTSIPTPFVILFGFLKFPYMKVTLSSVIFSEAGSMTRFIFGIPSIWLSVMAWAVVLAVVPVFLIFIYATISLQRELR